ncbi:MAG TPA: hypothetical protein VF276_18400, partial [Chloroflexia bacterium]
PLVAPQPVSGLGGFLSAIVNRVLGTTPAPPAPVAGPAPLDMPWARRPAAPAVEEDSAGEYEPAPAPLSVQRAVAAPPAPPAGATAVAALPPTAAAPVADSGPAVAMPAVPTSGDPFAVPVPGDLPAVPAAPAWVSTPAPAFDQTAGELAEAPVAQPWMDLDSLGDVLARVQTPLVPTAGLSTAGQGGLWRRIVGAFERALPGGGAPAAPMTLAWSGGSPATTGAGAAPFVPAQPGGYSAPSAGSAAPWPVYGPGAGAWIPAAGPGGAALLAGRLPADFGAALGPHALTPAVPVPYFDAESAGDADAEVGDAAQAWIAALDRMYGAPAAGSETMPLAVPYGGFVVPAAGASGVLPQDLAWVAETIGLESAPPSATPARRVWERPVAGAPAPPSWAGGQGPGFVPPAPGWIGDTGSAEYDSEAAAWADVVAAAVESDYGAGVPALALAGEEQGVPAVQDAPSGADHEAAGDAAGDLDELANSVYEIIRRRLEVERERDWA